MRGPNHQHIPKGAFSIPNTKNATSRSCKRIDMRPTHTDPNPGRLHIVVAGRDSQSMGSQAQLAQTSAVEPDKPL